MGPIDGLEIGPPIGGPPRPIGGPEGLKGGPPRPAGGPPPGGPPGVGPPPGGPAGDGGPPGTLPEGPEEAGEGLASFIYW